CPRAEIREPASAPHGKLPEGFYPGTCRDIPPAERRRRIESGERFALRIRAEEEVIEFDDLLLGPRRFMVDDFVVVRADGVHAYQLAVVVDDAAQGIGQVVRGADLADSTPRQILLQRLLGLPTPSYAHVPLVLGPEGERLPRRARPVTLAERDEPTAVTLALIAHSLGLASGRDRVDAAHELVAEFDPGLIPQEPLRLV